MSAIENTLPLNVPQGWQPPLGPIVHSKAKAAQRIAALQRENEAQRGQISYLYIVLGEALRELELYRGDSRHVKVEPDERFADEGEGSFTV